MTDFFRDEFVGTGSMSTHVPDVGTYFGTGHNVGVLNGTGQLQFVDQILASGRVTPFVPLVPPYSVQAQFTFTALPTVSPYDLYFELGLQNSATAPGDVSFAIYWDRTPAQYIAYCHWFDRNSFTTRIDFSAVITAGLNVPIVIRIEVGSGMRWYLNDVLLTSSVVVSPYAFDTVKYSTLVKAVGAGVVEYVSCFGPPVVPPTFWQDFDKTIETSAALLFSEPQTPPYVAPELELLPKLVSKERPPRGKEKYD